MIGFGFYNATNTSLDLNGPFLRYTTQPSLSGDVSNGGSVTLVGVTTAEFAHNPTIPGERVTNTGTVEYQWYIDGVAAVDGTNISGAGTSELTISNLTNPIDNGKSVVLYASYAPSAYGLTGVAVTVGSARSTGNAANAPLLSNVITINVTPVLSITLQPIDTIGIEDSFSIFNIEATTTDPSLNSQITYQWRINGVNLSDSGTVTGSKTNQLQIKRPEGTYTIDCVVTHPTADDSPLTSNQVTFTSESIKEFVNLETWDNFNAVEPFSTTQQNLNDGPLNVVGTARFGLAKSKGSRTPSTVHFLYAPEADVDVMIEMAAASGDSFGSIQPGQGGWGCFRMTLKKNVEYAIKLGSNQAELQPPGGGVEGSPIRGGVGGGLATIYEKNQLLAVLGGGGGAGETAAGGDGGGFNLPGENGFGRRGGRGGPAEGPRADFDDNFAFEGAQRGGSLASCPNPPTSIWKDQGIAQCADYTTSGHFVDPRTGEVYKTSAKLNRGYRPGAAGRINGGFGLNGGGGGGGSGSVGGNGAEGNGVGGGGGSGWADIGKVTVLRTKSGVHTGDAYLRVSLYDPTAPIPDPPVPNPPNFVRTDWDDPRIPGYKIGDGNQQTKPCG